MKDSRRGFTLVELLVVIGIIALLISMLLPALNRARESANAISCASNMRQAGYALKMYQQDNKGFLPRAIEYGLGAYWTHALRPYIPGDRPYEKIHCTSIDLEIGGSSTLTFGLNVALIKFDLLMFKRTDKLKNSSEIILVADSFVSPTTWRHPYTGALLGPELGPYPLYGCGRVDYRHNKTANVLFVDLHVSAERDIPRDDASSLGHQHIWQGIY